MKAATFASILAISVAGTACSQDAEAPAEAEMTEVQAEATEPDASQFNLRYPTTDTQPTSSASQFNLRGPDTAGQGSQGVRLPEGAVRDNALSNVPEVRGPAALSPDGGAPAQPDAAPAEPDDDIIRLDE